MNRRSMMKTAALSTAALSISGSSAAQQKLPDVEVRMHNGMPTVFVGGMPTALPAYSNFGQSNLKDAMRFFMKIGMDLYHLELARLPFDYNSSRFWVGDTIDKKPLLEAPEGHFDLDEQAKFILDGDPDAYLFIRFVIRPPESWKTIHENEYFITEEQVVHDTPSLASDAFWDAAAKFSAAVVGYVESTPWAEHVIGYGNYHHTEGIHMPVADGWLFDHNPLMTQKLREYLRKKYGTVEKLRAAYGDSNISFDTVEVPKDKLRGATPDVAQMPYFQAGKDNRALRDYLELTRDLFLRRFRQLGESMAGAANRKVLFLHDALKQTMPGWNLKGFFGYSSFGERQSWSPAYPELMAGSGSMDAASLDGAPGYNGLVTPHDYQARGIGGVYEPEGIADSVVLRGLYFSCEMDSRFHRTNEIGSARNLKEAEAILWRNLATGLARGFHSYWQWGFAVEDWFYCDRISALIGRQAEIMRHSLDWKHETIPGIAMIIDDSAALETNGAGNYLNEAIMWEQKMGMARCGVPHRIYLFEDLELPAFPKHRVFYFPNLFRADEKRMAILRDKVFRDGNVVVWGPGSGISDGESIGTESAARLTGFRFTLLPSNAQRRILISHFDHPVTRSMSAATVFGGPLPYGPVLMPQDGLELGLAWAKGGFNLIGLSVKDFGKGAAQSPAGIAVRGAGDYSALFTTAVNLPAEFWRNIARWAGAQVWCETDDILLADHSIVALHSLKSERKRIRLPRKCAVTDLATGKTVSRRTDEIVFNLEAPETRVFLLGD